LLSDVGCITDSQYPHLHQARTQLLHEEIILRHSFSFRNPFYSGESTKEAGCRATTSEINTAAKKRDTPSILNSVVLGSLPQQHAHELQFGEHTPLPLSMPSIQRSLQPHEVPPYWTESVSSVRRNLPDGHVWAEATAATPPSQKNRIGKVPPPFEAPTGIEFRLHGNARATTRATHMPPNRGGGGGGACLPYTYTGQWVLGAVGGGGGRETTLPR
jgi:hypothetical protein